MTQKSEAVRAQVTCVAGWISGLYGNRPCGGCANCNQVPVGIPSDTQPKPAVGLEPPMGLEPPVVWSPPWGLEPLGSMPPSVRKLLWALASDHCTELRRAGVTFDGDKEQDRVFVAGAAVYWAEQWALTLKGPVAHNVSPHERFREQVKVLLMELPRSPIDTPSCPTEQ